MRRTLLLLLLLLALLAAARAAVPDLRLAAGRALPFAVEPHPLRLSALSAADQLADEPFPTGAWWTNLVLQPGDAPVVPMPYALRVVGHRAHVSFPFRVVTPTVIQSGFIAQIVLAAADDQGGEPSNHQVVGFDSFGVRLRFDSDRQQLFTLLLVRGSPYLTMEFAGSRPVLQATDGLSLVRLKRHDRLVFMDGSDVEFAVYSIQVSNGQMWYVFASDPEIDLQLGADGRVQASQPFTGALRVALSLEATTMPYLLESASVYPVGAQVNFSVDARDEASLDFRWKTKSFAAFAPDTDSSSRRQAQLLMLALPHHIDTMEIQTPNEDKTLANKVINTLRYSSIRGLMKGVLGSVWYMREQLLPVEWNFKDQGLFSDEYNVKEIGASSVDEERRKRLAMRAEAKEKIIASLQQDISTYPMLMGDDSYNFGKQIARETRLLLLADKFGQQEVVDHQLKKIKDGILPWLDGTNPDKFVYDETFGGLVTSFGLHNQDADYGNGYYNDHHFHYGYFMYALAVVRKYDPDFVTKNALPIAMLLADIGTPLDAQVPFFADLPANRFFPIARHKDWFVGHSYASGLFTMQDGKSQESSSECVNAYYAMTLFSSLDDNAASKNSYHQYARLMLAMEIRSTKKYWHMKKNSQIYEPIFSKNAMVGVVGEMSVVYSTWFGDSPVYVHGINLLPFTPITPHLIDEAYVVDEYPLIAGYLDSLQSRDIWRSIVVLDHAILDAEAAWDELTNSVEGYDTWNSPSNSMYWVATRPSWFSQKNRNILTQPKLNENDMCFGYPACSTAGDNGTALLCCSTLPGCCPSNLGCCPKEDTDSLPPNSCFGEHQCGVLGLGCCNSIDGCCEPDPITGAVLGCCKNQHPVTRTPKSTTTPAANGTRALCHNEPQCSAAGLDCCATPGGCCSGPGPKLDCCSADITSASTATSGSDGSSACHSQPTCAAANLDCCATAGGCCEPDPVSGAVLDCCIAETSAPAPPDLTCHGEPVCAAAGVDCCATAEGCCQPDPVTGALLDCCSAFATGSSSAATGGAGTNANGSSKTLARMFVGVAILGAVGLVAYALVTCYRRRGYTSVDRDMRALYCAGLMVAVIAFFVFLIVMA